MLVVGLPNIRGGLAGWLSGEESTCEAGNTGSIPGSGRSPGAGHGNPLQNSLKKKKKKFIYLYFGCAGSSLLHGLSSSCSERGRPCSWGAQAFPCNGCLL